jgi:hypothetical protein
MLISRWTVWQGKPMYSDKTCPCAALFTINLTWPHLYSNPGHLRLTTLTTTRPLLRYIKTCG